MGTDIIDGVRQSTRVRRLEKAFSCANDFVLITAEQMEEIFEEIEQVFATLEDAATQMDIPLDPYLPEPCS